MQNGEFFQKLFRNANPGDGIKATAQSGDILSQNDGKLECQGKISDIMANAPLNLQIISYKQHGMGLKHVYDIPKFYSKFSILHLCIIENTLERGHCACVIWRSLYFSYVMWNLW